MPRLTRKALHRNTWETPQCAPTAAPLSPWTCVSGLCDRHYNPVTSGLLCREPPWLLLRGFFLPGTGELCPVGPAQNKPLEDSGATGTPRGASRLDSFYNTCWSRGPCALGPPAATQGTVATSLPDRGEHCVVTRRAVTHFCPFLPSSRPQASVTLHCPPVLLQQDPPHQNTQKPPIPTQTGTSLKHVQNWPAHVGAFSCTDCQSLYPQMGASP